MKLLLKGGASLDRCERDRSAEAAMQDFLSRHRSYANDEYFAKGRELIAGVRAHGSYNAYVREPHRQFPSVCALCSSAAAPRSGAAQRCRLERMRAASRTAPAGAVLWRSSGEEAA